MNMYTLSQTCQIPNLDKIYIEYFGKCINNRMFIEVGAYDGETVSNTSCLADAGWRGIYVEPITSHYVKCLERHKDNNVIVSNVAIGLENGIQKIYSNDVLSSLEEEHAQIGINKFNYPAYKEEQCYQIRMDQFLERYNVPKTFDLLVVDVEGREDQVFYSFNLNEWRPKMLIIELVDDHQYFTDNQNILDRVKKLRSYIHQNNYKELYRDDINTIFVDNDII